MAKNLLSAIQGLAQPLKPLNGMARKAMQKSVNAGFAALRPEKPKGPTGLFGQGVDESLPQYQARGRSVTGDPNFGAFARPNAMTAFSKKKR